MATTKIWAIKSTLSKAIDYIENPEKTQGQLLVSGYNTEPQIASLDFEMTATLARKVNYAKSTRTKNLAYHLLQSFSPDDNVTPEQAHELGRKLASEFTEGKFEFVVSTHIDKDHIHNHIIINAVSFYDYKRLRTIPFRTARTIRTISDRLCVEAGLSIVTNPQRAGVSYEDYIGKKTETTIHSRIRKRLNFILARATSYEDFKLLAAELGVVVNDSHQHITYLLEEGQEKALRGMKLADTDKYTRDGILEQVEINAKNQEHLKKSITAIASEAVSYDDFISKMADIGIKVKTYRSGTTSYKMPDGESTLSETILGEEYTTEVIRQVISGELTEFPPHKVQSIRECFEQQARNTENEPDVLIALKPTQILNTSTKGILLAVADAASNPAQLMLDKSHVIFDNNQAFAALGARFEYTLHGADGLDSINGEKLIRQLELANNVQPRERQIVAAQIKTMSLKGVTISLPSAGIERLFIPNDYVHFDAVSGTCSVSLYDNWTYTFTPIVTQDKQSLSRQSIKGAALCDAIQADRQHYPDGDLKHRINYVERQSHLAETEFLADMLLTMAKSPTRSSQGITLRLKECQQERALVETQIKSITEKCNQYRVAARCLQPVQSYKGLVTTMLSYPQYLQKGFRIVHEEELTAYDKAMAELERMDVSPEVVPEKVVELIRNREQQITDLQHQMRTIKQREFELEKMQLYAEKIHEEHTKENERDNRR